MECKTCAGILYIYIGRTCLDLKYRRRGREESEDDDNSSFGYSVAIIMAIGAVFAALNTMYSAVSARTVEIATLRALGFGGLPVVVSVMNENEAPHFRESPIQIEVPESVVPGTLLKSNIAFDPDYSELRYDKEAKKRGKFEYLQYVWL